MLSTLVPACGDLVAEPQILPPLLIPFRIPRTGQCANSTRANSNRIFIVGSVPRCRPVTASARESPRHTPSPPPSPVPFCRWEQSPSSCQHLQATSPAKLPAAPRWQLESCIRRPRPIRLDLIVIGKRTPRLYPVGSLFPHFTPYVRLSPHTAFHLDSWC